MEVKVRNEQGNQYQDNSQNYSEGSTSRRNCRLFGLWPATERKEYTHKNLNVEV